MASYYYLVASLPELKWEEFHVKFDIMELFQNIRQNLNDDDAQVLSELLLINDIKNLAASIANHTAQAVPHISFNPISNLSEEIISSYSKNTDALPRVLTDFLEEEQERLSSEPIRATENRLIQLYFEKLSGSSNQFLRESASFERSLVNIVTAINCRKHNYKISEFILEDEDTYSNLTKNSSRDFGLGEKFNYVSQIDEYVEKADVWELEKYINALRWNFYDSITSASFFQIENILSYIIKLGIIKRFSELDDSTGDQRLQELTAQAIDKLEIPEG